MRKYSMLVAVLAAGSLSLAGCGDDETTITNCVETSDCSAAEICHPVGKICVPTCEQASDCPDNQKNCAAITANGVTTPEKVCQCSTTELCNTDTTGLVCSTIDSICESECTADEDCGDFSPARKCDAGQCVPSQVIPTCTTNAQCTAATASKCDTAVGTCGACAIDDDCSHIAGSPVCNDSGVCEPTTACDPAKKDPTPPATGADNCAYGELCSAASTCVAAPVGTCAGAAKASGYSWDKAALAPVITSVSAVRQATSNVGTSPTDPESECGDGGPTIKVTLSFYAPNGLTRPSDARDLFKFVSSGGTVISAGYVKNLGSGAPKFDTVIAGICGTLATLTDRAIFIQDASGNQSNIVCLQ